MIRPCQIRTRRLRLIPASPGMLKSDLCRDYRELGRLLSASVPGSWPPEHLDEQALSQFVRMMEDGSDPSFCSWYWVLSSRDEQECALIGSGGTGSYPADPNAVMIGYSVLEEFQNKGYATEAVGGLIRAIFANPGILRVIAATYPELKASIRVLEKNGFVRAELDLGGEGMEEGSVAYMLSR